MFKKADIQFTLSTMLKSQLINAGLTTGTVEKEPAHLNRSHVKKLKL